MPHHEASYVGPLTPMAGFFQRRVLSAFLSASVLPGIVSAREIVVAPSGGDFATVAAGGSAAQPRDIVTVRAGVYNGAVSVRRRRSRPARVINPHRSGEHTA